MSDTITLTDLMRNYEDLEGVGWGVQFEAIRRRQATETLELLHLVKRDGIRECIKVAKDENYVLDGHKRVYIAALLGIRDIPVEFV